MKLDIHNRASALETTRGLLHVLKSSRTLVHGLKLDLYFYPSSINYAFYFIARLRTLRSANRTRPNFATCWELNRICKCTKNLRGLSQNLLILWQFSSRQSYARWRKIGQKLLPTSRKRSPWLRCQRNRVAPHSECKWNHRN